MANEKRDAIKAQMAAFRSEHEMISTERSERRKEYEQKLERNSKLEQDVRVLIV